MSSIHTNYICHDLKEPSVGLDEVTVNKLKSESSFRHLLDFTNLNTWDNKDIVLVNLKDLSKYENIQKLLGISFYNNITFEQSLKLVTQLMYIFEAYTDEESFCRGEKSDFYECERVINSGDRSVTKKLTIKIKTSKREIDMFSILFLFLANNRLNLYSSV